MNFNEAKEIQVAERAYRRAVQQTLFLLSDYNGQIDHQALYVLSRIAHDMRYDPKSIPNYIHVLLNKYDKIRRPTKAKKKVNQKTKEQVT